MCMIGEDYTPPQKRIVELIEAVGTRKIHESEWFDLSCLLNELYWRRETENKGP